MSQRDELIAEITSVHDDSSVKFLLPLFGGSSAVWIPMDAETIGLRLKTNKHHPIYGCSVYIKHQFSGFKP